MSRHGAIAAVAATAFGTAVVLAVVARGGPDEPKRAPRSAATATTAPQPPPATTSKGQTPDSGSGGRGRGGQGAGGSTEGGNGGGSTATPTRTGGRPLLVGVAEDAFQQRDQAAAQQLVDVARSAGFRAIVLSIGWRRGQTVPARGQLAPLRNAVRAARRKRLRVFLVVGHGLSGGTPRTGDERAQEAKFAAAVARALPWIRDVIVDNEPNLNTFWMPQFGAGGRDVAAEAYLDLLARAYDELKRVSIRINVLGGALAPRGSDRPELPRDTHSPTRFIRDLGSAYRASGRKRPVMDALSFHPYMESSRVPPSRGHRGSTTITLADYPRLVTELTRAFDGTPQPGAKLPIFYAEFGVQTSIPSAKLAAYAGASTPEAFDAVPEATQARFYRVALRLAACQPTVRGLFVFHVWDEPDLHGWQSGLYYVDRTPKQSLEPVRKASAEANAGKLGCRRTGR